MNFLPGQPSLGEMLGQGLNDVVSHWANVKSSESAFRGLGLNEAQAKSLARLQSPQLQQQLLQHQLQQQQQQASNAAINQILGEGLPPVNFQQPSALQGLPQQPPRGGMGLSPQVQQTPIEQASSVLQNPAFQKLQKQAQDAQQLQQAQLAPRGGMGTSQQPAAGALPGEGQAIIANQLAQQKEPSIKDQIQQVRRQKQALAAASLPFNQRAFLQKELDDREKDLRNRLERKEERSEKSVQESYKYNKETISKAREGAKRAEQDNQVLEQILKANKTGTLYQGPTRKLLEKLGLEDVITNTPTQFVAKHIERFLTGAPSKFGTGRFTNFLADAYQKGNLRLVNTKDAMDLIGKTIMLENKKEEAYYKAIRDIEKESKGSPLPYDLADQALERAKPQFDKYDNEAMKALDRALSSGNKTSFDSLPKATDYTGKTITDTQTGKKYKSNGSKWVKA